MAQGCIKFHSPPLGWGERNQRPKRRGREGKREGKEKGKGKEKKKEMEKGKEKGKEKGREKGKEKKRGRVSAEKGNSGEGGKVGRGKRGT